MFAEMERNEEKKFRVGGAKSTNKVDGSSKRTRFTIPSWKVPRISLAFKESDSGPGIIHDTGTGYLCPLT